MIELAVYCNFSNRYVCYSDSNLILMIYETFILAFDFIKLSLIHSFLVYFFVGKIILVVFFYQKKARHVTVISVPAKLLLIWTLHLAYTVL